MTKFESIKSKITTDMINRALDASDSSNEFLDQCQAEGWDSESIDLDKAIDYAATLIHDGIPNDIADMIKAEIDV